MARIYTQSKPKAVDISKAEGVNKETNGVFGAFNGALSGHQFPINSITNAKIEAPVYGTGVISSSDGSTNGIKTEMATQNYYFTEKTGSGTYDPDQTQAPYTTGAGSVPAAAKVFSLTSGWGAGWTSIGANIDAGAYLSFDAKEGMLKGTAVIDTDLPLQFVSPDYAPPVPWADGDDWARRLGIFVNDVLVADTDFNTCSGRWTTMLPFAVPIGSQPVEIDIRFKVNVKEHQGDDTTPVLWTGNAAARSTILFYVFSSQLSVRNQFR